VQQFTLHSHVGPDGVLHLDLPLDLHDADLEVQITVKSVAEPPSEFFTLVEDLLGAIDSKAEPGSSSAQTAFGALLSQKFAQQGLH
jgi:hypothetical protein